MTAPIQFPVRYRMCCLGDSQTDPGNGWCRPAKMWPHVLQARLQAAGALVVAENYGNSGDTSLQELARVHALFRYGTPDLAFLEAGVNDFPPGGGQVYTQAQTTAQLQAAIKALKHGAYGASILAGGAQIQLPIGPSYVSDPTALPYAGKLGQKVVCLADVQAGSGIAADTALVAAGVQATNVSTPSTSGNSGQSVWEWRRNDAGLAGWGRIVNSDQTAATACKRIVLISANYLNWTTGGDSLSTPFSNYVQIRAAQAAAVAAENVAINGVPSVILTDVYGYQKALIVAGAYPDFTATGYVAAQSWNQLQNNQHHNEIGNAIVVEAVVNGGPAGTAFPAAWLTALSS